MYSIEIENLTKKFKEKTAVHNVSLKIKQGELFSLLGTNGAGKTTLIKSLVGILSFEEGDILINNKSIKEDPIGCKLDMYIELYNSQSRNYIVTEDSRENVLFSDEYSISYDEQ